MARLEIKIKEMDMNAVIKKVLEIKKGDSSGGMVPPVGDICIIRMSPKDEFEKGKFLLIALEGEEEFFWKFQKFACQ